jgi:hypothetical protein
MVEHRGFMWDFIDFIGQSVDTMSHTAARIRYQWRRHPAHGDGEGEGRGREGHRTQRDADP